MAYLLLFADCIHAQKINRAEYYIDTDPGFGKGTSLPVTAAVNISADATVSLNGLPPGFHTLCIRTRSNSGKWSLAEGRSFYISKVTAGSATINKAEYYIDNDPGFGKGTNISITRAPEISACVNIQLPVLSAGTHTLFLRVKDNLGKWSLPEATTINVVAATNVSIASQGTTIKCGSLMLTANTTGGTWTYQWYKDCDVIPGATTKTYQATTAGSYSVLIMQGSNAQFANPVAINYQSDITPPVITCPADIVSCSPTVNFSVTATDDCNYTIVTNPTSGTSFPTGTTTVIATATDEAGNSSICSFNVTVRTRASRPGSISGNAFVCTGTTQTYTIAPVTNADSYTWTVPAGWTITSGQGTTSIAAIAGAPGNIGVIAVNSCGNSSARTLTVNSGTVPVQPGTITGYTSVIAASEQAYSIAAVVNATGYTWTLPSGWQLVNGQGTTSITAIAGNSGPITVSADNNCGSSTAQQLNVIVGNGVITKTWDKRFGGTSSDGINALQQTTDGGYILGGFSSSGIGGDKTQPSKGDADYWIIKTDECGNKLWDKSLGASYTDRLTSMQQTVDGGFILGGTSYSDANGDKTGGLRGGYGSDYWIIKTDANGNKIWDKTFGATGYDYLTTVFQTIDGGYILGGYSNSRADFDKTSFLKGGYDYWIIRIDANGNKLWDKAFGGSLNDYLVSIQQTSDGGYILGGSSNSGVSGNKTETSKGSSDFWIIKTDANGSKQWDKTIGGTSNDNLYGLQQTTDGGYILGGESQSGAGADKTEVLRGAVDYWLVKINPSGNKIWDKTFGGSETDRLYALQQTSDGGYILGGYSKSSISGDKSENSRGNSDFWFIKTDANGNKIWDKTLGGHGEEQLYALQQTSDGGFVAAGSCTSGISGDVTEISRGGGEDFWVTKLGLNLNTTLNLQALPSQLCKGVVFSVPYTGTGNFAPCNVFKVQLSNWDGSNFLDPTEIGSKRTTTLSGTIDCIIPDFIPYSTRYRIRIFAYSPSIYSNDNGTDITIGAPQPVIDAPPAFCTGKPFTISCTTQADAYLWSNGVTTQNITVSDGGIYTVTITKGGCQSSVNSNLISNAGCTKPDYIQAADITATTATITWSGAYCADSFLLQVKKSSDVTWKSYRTTSTSKKIKGLSPNTTYKFKVQTICNSALNITSGFTNTSTFTTYPLSIAKSSANNIQTDMLLDIRAIPNPATYNTHLLIMGTNQSVTIILTDAYGKMLWIKENVSERNIELPLQNFANSTYFLSVNNRQIKKTIKIIKKE
jgi:hypothetical protein